MTTRLVPIAVGLIGAPVPGFELTGRVAVEPPAVRATGPGLVIEQLDTLRVEAIDLTQLTDTDTLTRVIQDLPQGVSIDPPAVRVIVPIRPIPPDTAALAPVPSPGESGRRVP